MMIKSFLPQGSRPVYYYVAVEDPSLLFRDRWARELAALGSIARLCFRGGMKDEFFIWCWNRLGTSLEQAWNMLGTSLEQAGTGLEQAWNKLEQAWNRLGTSLEQGPQLVPSLLQACSKPVPSLFRNLEKGIGPAARLCGLAVSC